MDDVLANIAANDSHHDFHHNIKSIKEQYQTGVKGNLTDSMIDKNEAITLGYVVKSYNDGASTVAVDSNASINFHNEELINKTSGEFEMNTVSGIDYKVFKLRIKEYETASYGTNGDFAKLKEFMKNNSADGSVFHDFDISGSIFVHDASSINIYERLFKTHSGQGAMELFFAHCPEISNDPAPKATIDTVNTYGTPGKVQYISVIPSNRGDSVYNYLLDKKGIYDTEGKNTFNSTYQVKFTEFNIGKKNNFKTDVTYSDLDNSGTKIFEHKYKVESRSSDVDTTISSVTGKINKLRNKVSSGSGKLLTKQEIFDLNTSYQMKRGGDQLQVSFTKRIHDRIFEKKGLVEFKTIGQISETGDLIKNKRITDVYFVTHDQIAAAFALSLGVNVIFANNRPGIKTVLIYKSTKTIDKVMVEKNKYERLNLFFGNDSNFKDITASQVFVNNAKQYNKLFKLIKDDAPPDYLLTSGLKNVKTMVSELGALSGMLSIAQTQTATPNIQLPLSMKYDEIPEINKLIKLIIENKIYYDKFLLEIIENGIINGKGKLKSCINSVTKNPKRGKEYFKTIFKLLHTFIYLINNYTITLDILSFIEKTKRDILDDTIDQIVDVINSTLYFNDYLTDVRTKNVPKLAYIYNKKLGQKTALKKDTIVGFDDIFKNSNNELIDMTNTRKGFNENDIMIYVKAYFTISESKKIASSILVPENPSNYYYELKGYFQETIELLKNLSTVLQTSASQDDTTARFYAILSAFIKQFISEEYNSGLSSLSAAGQSGGMCMFGGDNTVLVDSIEYDSVIVVDYLLNEYNTNGEYFTNFIEKKPVSNVSFILIDINIRRLKNNLKQLFINTGENGDSQELFSRNKNIIQLALISIFICNSLSRTNIIDVINNLYSIIRLVQDTSLYVQLASNIIEHNRYELDFTGDEPVFIGENGMYSSMFLDEFTTVFNNYIGFYKSSVRNYTIVGKIRGSYDDKVSQYLEAISMLITTNNMNMNQELFSLKNRIDRDFGVIINNIRKLDYDNSIQYINVCNKLYACLEILYTIVLHYIEFYKNYTLLQPYKKDTILLYFNSLSDVKLLLDGLDIITYFSVLHNDVLSIYDNGDEADRYGLNSVKTHIQLSISTMNTELYKMLLNSIDNDSTPKVVELIRPFSTMYDYNEAQQNYGYANISTLVVDEIITAYLDKKRDYLFATTEDVRLKLFNLEAFYNVSAYAYFMMDDGTNLFGSMKTRFPSLITNFKNLDELFVTGSVPKNGFFGYYTNSMNIHLLQCLFYNFITEHVNTINGLYTDNALNTLHLERTNKIHIYIDNELYNTTKNINLDIIELYNTFKTASLKDQQKAYCLTKKAKDTGNKDLTTPLPVIIIDDAKYSERIGNKEIMNKYNVELAINIYETLYNYYEKNRELVQSFQSCSYETASRIDTSLIQRTQPISVGGRKGNRNMKKHTRKRMNVADKKHIKTKKRRKNIKIRRN